MKNQNEISIARERFQESLEWLNYNGPVSTLYLDSLLSESDKKHSKIESIDA